MLYPSVGFFPLSGEIELTGPLAGETAKGVDDHTNSHQLMLCAIQPTAGEACSLQSAHQIGHFAGGLPDDPGLVIGDHA
jgi:hypothetical protein